jgi:hypothetical protein
MEDRPTLGRLDGRATANAPLGPKVPEIRVFGLFPVQPVTAGSMELPAIAGPNLEEGNGGRQ